MRGIELKLKTMFIIFIMIDTEVVPATAIPSVQTKARNQIP